MHRDTPLDRSSAPRHPRTVITPDYRQAVIDHRKAWPRRGPVRIAQDLRRAFPHAHRGTVLSILQQEALTRPPTGAPRAHGALTVGRHRIQMDIQQLPAIEGEKGFEYKISCIHMRTRLKYSEIHRNYRSETVADVLRRAMDFLPPFF